MKIKKPDYKKDVSILRGDIYYCDLGDNFEHITSGTRPVIIVSENINNRLNSNVTVIPITSRTEKKLPCHITLLANHRFGLYYDSLGLTESITTVSKSQLKRYIGYIDDMSIINAKLQTHLGVGLECNLANNIISSTKNKNN